MTASEPDPHRGQAVLAAGAPLDQARVAMMLVHGRGATAEDILKWAELLAFERVSYLAPQAACNTWYPYSFTVPLASNEPWLSSALAVVGATLERLAQSGITPARTVLLGFSQGACLTLEYVARYAQRFGGVVGLSGGLIGPDGTPRDYPGSLAGTPVFLGCSDVDPHIPKERVEDSATVLRGLGADLTMRLYPHMGHTTNDDEIAFVRRMMADLVSE